MLYNLPRGVLWAVLIALLLVRSNRNRHAWTVLVPLIVVHAAWPIVKQILPFPSQVVSLFGQAAVGLAMVLAVLWLTADKVACNNRAATFFLAAVIMLPVAVVGSVCASGASLHLEAVLGGTISGLCALILLTGLTATGFCCRWRYSDRRFMLWLLFWVILLGVTLTLAYVGVVLSIMGIRLITLIRDVLAFLGWGVGFGAIVYLVALPFMILALRSRFYRGRLEACFRLERMAPRVEDGADTNA